MKDCERHGKWPQWHVVILLMPTTMLVAAEPTKSVDFLRDVQPILARTCYACHGPDEQARKADVRLDRPDGLAHAIDGRKIVEPGQPEASELIRRILTVDPDERMPPADSGQSLSAEQQETLRRWVEEGAPWRKHWAFVPPRQQPLPNVQDGLWPAHAIDRFVLARLESNKLAPSPPAEKHVLARRVALDLTGLPPTAEQMQAFVADSRPDAYERFVDELLRSPAYGERWARVWLDLARYADSKGYEKDRTRTIWRYRDWVIEAFNADMPYDQFTREQLAGDLLPGATLEQQLATAFHRNTLCNDEGGTDNEEFRIAAVKDRIDTTFQVWMGLTLGCAKCHSHKYDPISHREYYQAYAFLNQTEDNDEYDDRPLLPSPTTDQQQAQAALQSRIDALTRELQTPTQELQTAATHWEAEILRQPGWSTLELTEAQAASGSAITRQPDGSWLVAGEGPPQEAYTLTAPVDVAALTALRLEVLPHDSLPRHGVGRAKGDGNFVLTGLTAKLITQDGREIPLRFSDAEADFAQQNYPVAHVLKNPDPRKHGWAVSPQQSQPHRAMFRLGAAEPVPAGSRLTVQLDHQFEFDYPGFSIGRFRLAMTSAVAPRRDDEVPQAIRELAEIPPATRSPAQARELLTYFAGISPITAQQRQQILEARQQLAAIPVPQTPVLRELPANRQRVTRIHNRGNFLDPGEEVLAATPSALHQWPEGAPQNRLGLAQWLTDRSNPLTARVAVNRVWSQLFGTGLVETEEDFGSQGAPPSHPEVLDWLAVEFMDQGWSFKRLCKTIVMSRTYQQSSAVTPALRERDRFNRLLARGPRFRLEAEMIRDTSLAAAGLLSTKRLGPSVMPWQPEGIWKSTYNTDKWEVSPGEDRHRRGLYTFLKRTSPYPAMTTFDAPSRELCTVRRISTNTPLQALVTLNDQVFIEAAQHLARRMVARGGGTIEARLTWALEQVLLRPARPGEIQILADLYRSRLKHYEDAPVEAVRMATEPLGAVPEGADAVELAALTAVCNVILNLDEFLTRG